MSLCFSLAFLGSPAARPTQRFAFGGACEGLLARNMQPSHPPDTFKHTHQVNTDRNMHSRLEKQRTWLQLIRVCTSTQTRLEEQQRQNTI